MIYLFEQFELDEESMCLFDHGKRVPIEPKALRVLILLVSRAGRVVEKDAIFQAAWKDTFVEESTLTRAVALLRKHLGDDPRHPRFIETVPTFGYRFIAPVATQNRAEPGTLATNAVAEAQSPPPVNPTGPLRMRIAVATLACLALAGLFLLWVRGRVPRPAAPTTLAILPISNRTGDQPTDALADGLTQDLIRRMADVQNLKVMSQTSVFPYKGQSPDVREIGRALHVGYVMSSELRRSGDRTVLNTELSSVADGSVVLSQQYIPEGADFRPVRADVVRDLLAALHLNRRVDDAAITSSAAAYAAYLAGEGFERRTSPEDQHRAIQQFEQAVQLDPKFARAWEQMAEAHLMLGLYFEPPTQEMPVARRDLETAQQLDPTQSGVHGSMGVIDLVYDLNLPAAQSELALDGPGMTGFHLLSCSIHLMHQAGQAHQAEETLHRMEEEEPGASIIVSELGCVAYYRRQYADAVAYYGESLKTDPGSPIPYWGMGKSLGQEKKYSEAVDALQQFEAKNGFEPPILTAEMGYALGRAGKSAEAKQKIAILQQAAGKGFVDPYLIAVVYLGLGDRDAAFSWLEKAYTARSAFMISILSDPKWDPVNTDPRFEAIVRRMNVYRTAA